MNKEKAKKMVREIALDLMEKAKKNLERDGHLLPIAILDTPRGMALHPMKFTNADEKHMEFLKLAAVVEVIGATQVFFITEAWVSRRKTMKEAGEVRPSLDPDRGEMIVVSYKTRESEGAVMQEFVKKGERVEFVGKVEVGEGSVAVNIMDPIFSVTVEEEGPGKSDSVH